MSLDMWIWVVVDQSKYCTIEEKEVRFNGRLSGFLFTDVQTALFSGLAY